MNANRQMIERLTRSETFLSCERAYTEATGLPLTLRPLETWKLPFHGKDRENAFCALMAAKTHTCAACLQLQTQLAQAAMDQPATRTCAYGLCETAVPVRLGSQTIGFLQTGQVMGQKPSPASFQRAVAHARELGVNIRNEPTRRAYYQTPVATQKKIKSVSHLLAILAEHLATKSNQIIVRTAYEDSPLIVRAKQFIDEHYTEELSLGNVAASIHTSRFHLCKQFRRVTGLNFTEFVSRTRVEKAKDLLLNPNLRVSEIAYEVGFQSLTHFNRMFKRIMGSSPTECRRHLFGLT
jgi:AraC-like DNA-binding protein